MFLFTRRTNSLHDFQIRDNKPPVEILQCQFCNTVEWSSHCECWLLTPSDVITRASDLLCRISPRLARRPGMSPREYLSWLVSSLVCLCCRAQDFTHRRCWYSYFVLLLYYNCSSITPAVTLWRGFPPSFLELVGCLDEQIIYCAVTYFSYTRSDQIKWLPYTWQSILE